MKLLRFATCCVLSLAAPPTGQAADVDPRGPIENPGIQAVVDSEGVYSPGFVFKNNCQKPTPWQAQWIWLPCDSHKVSATSFRKEIALAEAPKQVLAWLSADVKYRLYINGRLVSRGPVDIGVDFAGGSTERWFYDYRDLTTFFHKGKNILAAEVFHRWPLGHTVSRGHPGLIFEAQASLPDGSKQNITSDATWKAAPADCFSANLTYDAGKEPAGWRLDGFDDTKWAACEITKDIWSPLIASEIPPLMETRYPILRIDGVHGGVKVLPDATKSGRGIAVTEDGSFSVQFDRVLCAYPSLRLKGGKGAHVAIQAHRKFDMILSGGEQYYEWPVVDEIPPSFTVTFSNVKEPIEVEDVGANFTSQPVDYVGSFSCSDEQLNKIWKVSRWAVQICMQTHHLDSPNHYEPISDPGDYAIEAMVGYNAFGQPWLARQDIRKFAWLLKNEKYHNFHTSYSLYWLQMLMDYYHFTGDKALLVEMAPYVHELMDTYASWIGKNGIISEAPNYMFMDWVTIGGFGCHHPPAVIGQGYLTALYYDGLRRADTIATIMDDRDRSAKYKTLLSEIKKNFNRELWVSSKGLYRDGIPFQSSVKPGKWLPADKQIETFSPHVNLLAVLYRIVPTTGTELDPKLPTIPHSGPRQLYAFRPSKQHKAIVEKVLAEQPLNTQPWFMHWVFQAIDGAGLFNKYGTTQLRRWQILPQTQSFREMWDRGDVSHGWCSTPLVQMSSLILGVTTVGYAPEQFIYIRPNPCDLTWAKGKVPTHGGIVEVEWQRSDGKFTLIATIPKGTNAMVELPTNGWRACRTTMNGKQIELQRVEDALFSSITPGTWKFEVTNVGK